jgi:DNA polymerase I
MTNCCSRWTKRAADDLIGRVKAVMQGAAAPAVHLDVPLIVDAGRGPNWAAAH